MQSELSFSGIFSSQHIILPFFPLNYNVSSQPGNCLPTSSHFFFFPSTPKIACPFLSQCYIHYPFACAVAYPPWPPNPCQCQCFPAHSVDMYTLCFVPRHLILYLAELKAMLCLNMCRLPSNPYCSSYLIITDDFAVFMRFALFSKRSFIWFWTG